MFLTKAQITRKNMTIPKLFFVNNVRAHCTILIGLKIKPVKIYSVVKSVKLLLVLSIYYRSQ